MFAAHLFAGYLWTRRHVNRVRDKLKHVENIKYYIWFGIFCSVLPDFDLLYFYTLDHRQHLHHSYWTHMPVFWLLFSAMTYIAGKWLLNKNLAVICLVLLGNTWLHLFLDTVAGGIHWFYPWSNVNIQFMHISPRFDWWVLNYIFHWTFLFELLIMAMAAYTFWIDKNAEVVEE